MRILLCAVVIFGFSVFCNGETAENGGLFSGYPSGVIPSKPRVPIKTVGVLLYDGYNTLDAMGPFQILSEMAGAKVFFVAKKRGIVKSELEISTAVSEDFKHVQHLDILVIPGGTTGTQKAAQDPETLNWIKKIDATSFYTASVCTGGWILGATGLLRGRHATTNWYRAREKLEQAGAIFEDQRYVRDGKYWTSAGVTAGMDLALALVEDLFGTKYTQAVMLDLQYAPAPPVVGGNISKTPPDVLKAMKSLYDHLFLKSAI